MKQKIDEQCIANGYASCSCIKAKIDAVLEQNAVARMQLGISSTPEEIAAVKELEIKRLKSVRKYDPEKIDRILNSEK